MRMLPSSSLTVPDVQISRFRFFMEELGSRKCSDGRSGLPAEGDALGEQLGVDDQLSAFELVAQTSVVALQLLDLSCRGIRLWPPSFWSERRLICHADLLAPARDHRGVDVLAAQEGAERTGILAALGLGEQPALLAPGELAAPGDRNDLRVTAHRFQGRLSSGTTGSFCNGFGAGTRQSIQRRLHQ